MLATKDKQIKTCSHLDKFPLLFFLFFSVFCFLFGFTMEMSVRATAPLNGTAPGGNTPPSASPAAKQRGPAHNFLFRIYKIKQSRLVGLDERVIQNKRAFQKVVLGLRVFGRCRRRRHAIFISKLSTLTSLLFNSNISCLTLTDTEHFYPKVAQHGTSHISKIVS